ncbi:MAG: hypothetical protein QXV17_15190 [Candidatus Micrarchaeaceae archaeon]
MTIYSVALPLKTLHELYTWPEYVKVRQDGDKRGVAAGHVLLNAYMSFITNFDIYKNPSAFLSTKKFMLKCPWIWALYDNKGWGSESTDKFIAIMLERYMASKISHPDIAMPDQEVNRTFAIPTLTYYKFLDSPDKDVDIESIVTQALEHFFKKYYSFTTNDTTRNVKFEMTDSRWEQIKLWKGYSDKVIDRWIAFALEDYWLDEHSKKL